MSQKERYVIAFVLFGIATLVGVDLLTDSSEGIVWWHLFVEGSMAVSALFGVFYILRGSFKLKHQLEREMRDFSEFKKEAEAWRADSKKYIEGLAQAIDSQLRKWKLSVAEKEVAFLLLKGLSLKEVAEVRKTTEKTARVQSMAIYSKAGLSGRSELSAFFLEDLLAPTTSSLNLKAIEVK
jgi:DNA-binding CsgD family transcriptional regulator